MRKDIKTAADLKRVIEELPNNVVITNTTGTSEYWLNARDRATLDDAMVAIKARTLDTNKETDWDLLMRKTHTARLVKAVQTASNLNRFKPITKITKLDEGTPA